MTEYQVFIRQGENPIWREIGEPVEASGKRQAIKLVVTDALNAKTGSDTIDGEWNAVPTRSWGEPITVEIEVEERVKFK